MSKNGSSFDTLVADLKNLRKGIGITREKVLQSLALMDVLNVRQPAHPYEYLLEQVDQLGSSAGATRR